MQTCIKNGNKTFIFADNEPFIRDRRARVLPTVANAWRRDLLPGPCINTQDALSLGWKFQMEAVDKIKEHSSKSLNNVIPYQWLTNGKSCTT